MQSKSDLPVQSQRRNIMSPSLPPTGIPQSLRLKDQHRQTTSSNDRKFFSLFSPSKGPHRPSSPEVTGPTSIERPRSRRENLRGSSPAFKKFYKTGDTSARLVDEHFNTAKRKSRPLSRLSFGKFPKANTAVDDLYRSSTLPRSSSMVLVAESVISSPILRSTTNIQVARCEGVHHISAEISGSSVNVNNDPMIKPPEQKSSYESQNRRNQDKFRHNKRSYVARTISDLPEKVKHIRRVSASFILENTWPRRFGGSTSLPLGISETSAQRMSSLPNRHKGDGNNSSSRRFDNLHMSSRSLLPDFSAETLSMKQRTPSVGELPCLPRMSSESIIDTLMESLKTSFVAATESLDVPVTHATKSEADVSARSKLRNARSFFSVHSYSSYRLKSVGLEKTSLQKEATISCNQAVPQTRGQRDLLKAISKKINAQAQKSAISSSKLVQMRFSERENRYIRAKPDLRSPYGINPLAMHPEINAFARPPSEQAQPSTPSRRTSHDSSDDDGSETIDHAIIYCPSTGSLSEYSRRSPSPRFQITTRQQRTQQETPTRKPLHRRSGSVLKRSFSSLIGRSTSVMRLASYSPSRSSGKSLDPPILTKVLSFPEPKSARGEGKIAGRIRGRAVSSPNVHCPEGLRAVWDYQPTTPSPLRKATKITDLTGGRQRAVTTTTPVKGQMNGSTVQGPRSAMTNARSQRRHDRLKTPKCDGHSLYSI